MRVPIDHVAAAEDNPRRSAKHGDFEGLKRSIEAQGIVTPLLVTPVAGDSGGYLLVDGHRRLLAAQELKMAEVPVDVRPGLSTADRLAVALATALQREELDAVEEATGYFRVIEAGMRHADLAKAVGRSQAHVRARLQLLNLPAPVLALVKRGDISPKEALEAQAAAKDDQLLLDAIRRGGRDPVHAVERARQERDAEALAQQMTEHLASIRVTVVEDVPQGWRKVGDFVPPLPTTLEEIVALPQFVRAEDDASHPGVCATVDRTWSGDVWAQTWVEPGAARAAAKAIDPAFGKLTEAQLSERTRRREEREREGRRRAVLTRLAQGRKAGLSELVAWAAGEVRVYELDASDVVRLLGREENVLADGERHPKTDRAWVQELARAREEDPARYLHAVRLHSISRAWGAGKDEYRDLLRAAGCPDEDLP
jgi:ParB family chromosome partitioning protein